MLYLYSLLHDGRGHSTMANNAQSKTLVMTLSFRTKSFTGSRSVWQGEENWHDIYLVPL